MAKRVQSDVVKTVAAGTKIKQKDIRKRSAISRATAKKPRAKFTAYARPVPARALLTKAQLSKNTGTGTNKTGVRARGHQWDGAFIQKVGSGPHVFRRKGKQRNPIELVEVDISKPVKKHTPGTAKKIMKRDYKNLLAHELDYRLRKYSKR